MILPHPIVHHPFAYTFGSFSFTGFGLAILLCFLVGQAVAQRELVRRGYDARTVLMGSRVGLMMQAKGLANEVEYCARVDILDVVARLDGGVVRSVNP